MNRHKRRNRSATSSASAPMHSHKPTQQDEALAKLELALKEEFELAVKEVYAQVYLLIFKKADEMARFKEPFPLGVLKIDAKLNHAIAAVCADRAAEMDAMVEGRNDDALAFAAKVRAVVSHVRKKIARPD
jgi:hypothetical protein